MSSYLAKILFNRDPEYRSLVHSLARILKTGKFNRALLLDAVFIADETNAENQIEDMIRHPNISANEKIVFPINEENS